MHAYKIASELHARGLSAAIAVPDDPETVGQIGRPPFRVLSYAEASTLRPDLVHAFTPRERVRKLATQVVTASGCPFVVHLEDNDRAILAAELARSSEDLEALPAVVLDGVIRDGQVHPIRGPHFVRQASGVSAVIERLLELAPAGIPTAVVTPGVDEDLLEPARSRDDVRADLRIGPGDFAVLYTGTIHAANADDMRSLYGALARLRADGHPVVLVKTGWNAIDPPELESAAVRELGWTSRDALSGLLGAADVLVQPGRPGPFNDYRFPAKLPDYLASGKPVVLTRTNLGLKLRNGREAIVLDEGTEEQIYDAIASLRRDPRRARELGAQGRAFAFRELRWPASVDEVEALYRDVTEPPPLAALELPPPVRVVAVSSARASEKGALVFTRRSEYETALRQLVLRALAQDGVREPVVYADPRGAPSNVAWLKATRAGARDGVRQFYASRGLRVSKRAVEKLVRID
ncbi:MAG: glycosyltransferase [Myxococcales bacterium]|nr:glycosyltransferase [Myxococcales bacterium]